MSIIIHKEYCGIYIVQYERVKITHSKRYRILFFTYTPPAVPVQCSVTMNAEHYGEREQTNATIYVVVEAIIRFEW